MRVAVQEIESRFTEYLRRMQGGEEIVVTDGGRPIARLVPADPVSGESPAGGEAEALARLDALPWIRPGKGGKPRGSKQPIPWKPGDEMISEMICEDRE
ncbi:MAG: type II toxin-antitoxin system prevent-host-death family antitoxin [Deferrisomatales bacterium]|nr:type II toxin-antitoxin system prevent-host-death family antitoxin [Deferrisomatales bacterium]